MKTSAEWLKYIYSIKKEDEHIIAKLSELAGLTVKGKQSGDLSGIEEIFNDIDVSKCASIVLVAFCRYTFSLNQFLPSWFTYRDRCFEKLVSEEGEERAKTLMRGLMENKVYKPMFPEFETQVLHMHPSLVEKRNQE